MLTDIQTDGNLSKSDFETLKDPTLNEQRRQNFSDKLVSIGSVLEESADETEDEDESRLDIMKQMLPLEFLLKVDTAQSHMKF